MRQGRVREAIGNLPNIDPDTIPDLALWAAVVCLGILAHAYRYEERYDGYDGNRNLRCSLSLGITRDEMHWEVYLTSGELVHSEPEDPETKVINFHCLMLIPGPPSESCSSI